MKKLLYIFALLLWYCFGPVPASAMDTLRAKGSDASFLSAGHSLPSTPVFHAVKPGPKFSSKLTFNHRKKAMRSVELALPSGENNLYKTPSALDSDLFHVQTDCLLRPFFGHSKRGPPAVQ